MFSILRKCLGAKPNPIGVDFGTDTLKLAQVANHNGEWRLAAAGSIDVPGHVRHDPHARMAFLIEATRDILAQGKFVGRSAVLALPAASLFIQHLRLPKMDEEATKKALPWEARGKLPIDPTHAVLRHHVAGEIYQEQEARNEVIVMAAGRELVNQFLATAAKAKLDVIGMHVEPKAIVDCFAHIYRRKTDADVTNCFVDIGCAGTRAFIARGTHILFARAIPIGGDHFTRAVASSLGINNDEAKALRLRLCTLQPTPSESQQKQEINAAPPQPPGEEGLAVLNAALCAAGAVERRRDIRDPRPAPSPTPTVVQSGGNGKRGTTDVQEQARQAEQACREPLNKLVQELDLCRRYYEATFPSRPVDRLVFVGGEAKHRSLCQHIAREMGLAAQVGDPLVRMGRVSEVGIESGIDRRQPQPNWAVAIGLSLGSKEEA